MVPDTEFGQKIDDLQEEQAPHDGQETGYLPVPAGFWIRVAAAFLDGLVFLPIIAILFYNMIRWKSMAISVLLIWLPGVLYKPLMEAYWGATLGKMACRLVVVDEHGHLLSVFAAYIRFIPLLLLRLLGLASMLAMFLLPEFSGARSPEQISELPTPYILEYLQLPLVGFIVCDCLVVVVTNGKRAIHDFMAGSYCVMSSSWKDDRDGRQGQ